MPVSGCEEPGFKPIGWHFSDSVAGVPIKKRRFLFVVPQSPPSQTQSSQAVEPGLSGKEQSNLKAESSPNAGDGREVSGIAGKSRSYSPEEEGKTSVDRNVNFVESNVNLPGFGLGEPTLAVASGSGAEKSDKQEVTIAERSVSPKIPGNIELQLAQQGATVLGIVGEAIGKKKIDSNDGSKLPKSPGNSELPVVPKEPMNSTLTVQISCGKHELIDPCSWKLALAKADPGVNNKSNVSDSTISGTLPPANRSLWDLNTTMDTWEGSMNDVATSHKLRGADGSDRADTHDTKPVISSAVKVFGEPESTGVKNKYKSKLHSFSNLLDQQSISGDLLNLSLSPSGLQSAISQEHSSMARKVDSRVVETNLRSSETLVSPASKLNMIGSIVKSEPFDEVNKQDFRVANANNSVKFSDTRIVKSEPLDVYRQESLKSLKISDMKLVDHGLVKSEQVYGINQEILKAVEEIPSQLEQATCNAGVPIIRDGLHCSEIPARGLETDITGRLLHPSESHTSAMGLPMSAKVSNQSDFPSCTRETLVGGDVTSEACGSFGHVNSGVASESVVPDAKVSNTGDVIIGTSETKGSGVGGDVTSKACVSFGHVNSGVASESVVPDAKASNTGDVMIGTSETKGSGVGGDVTSEACESFGHVISGVASESVVPDAKVSNTGDVMIGTSETIGSGGIDPELSRLKLTRELRPDSYRLGEVAESDEEKINISADMLEDDSYDTGCESDGRHAIGVSSVEDKQHGAEDDYEDGEVRELLLHKDGACEETEIEHIDYGESENRDAGICGDHVFTSTGEDRGAKIEENGELKNAFCGEECNNSLLSEKNDQDMGTVATSQELLGVEMPSTGSDKKVTISAARKKSLQCSEREDGSKGHEVDLTSSHALSAGQGTTIDDGQSGAVSQLEHVKGADPGEMNHLVLPKAEESTDGDEATIDANSRGSRIRLTNLAQASNGSPSSRLRTIPGSSLPSPTEKEIYTDVVLRGDKIHTRGNRDEGYDGTRKFERERNQDLAVGSPGSDFLHGRGRDDNRLDGDWDSDHDFFPEHYNGPIGFRLPRSKNAAAVAAAKLECNGFIVAPDGTIVGSGRGGRKLLDDELSVFRHPLSRRRSPVGREGPGTHLVCRPPRDASPDRCTGGLRHEEKFMRGMPDNILDPVFSRSQPQYERIDPFLIGDRSFSPVQRRVPPRMPRTRSKSPPRSRSPGPWSSPRQSPDGFDGQPVMTRRRSPPVYRMDRMRSPHQRPCYADDMVGRRHGSPPYLSRLPNEIREIGPSRELEHPRPFMSNRSARGRGFPARGRGLPRNNRRFDMIDPRERTETDEYFDGPMRSSRFHELGAEGAVDERRKCNERRGPIRSFRPPYNGTHVENFRFHFEDGPRPYQFCPEADTEFHERSSLREREFDRRFKSRPGNTHRRSRNIEEQDENYRHDGQGWNDAGFDDVARVKRRRF